MTQTWDIDTIVPASTSPSADIQKIVDGFNALRSCFSGATEPASADLVAYMFWADTTTGLLKQRNAANNAWVTIGTMATIYLGLLSLAGGNLTGGLNDAKTTVASATTPDIFATTVGNTIDYTGTVTCTGFATAPQAGCQRTLVCAGAAVFTAGANLLIDGVASGSNYVAMAGDKLLAIAVTTTQVRLTPMRYDGAAMTPGPIGSPIINGNMEIWQRGTSFAAAANSSFAADRWKWSYSGAGVVTLSQSTNVPTVAQAGVLFVHSLDVDVSTPDSSIAAGDVYAVGQYIEGYNWRHFAQREFTVSFWVRDTVTGEHAVAFKNSGQDRSYVATYTINASDTWEYKTVTVPASPSAGTWDYASGIGLYIAFTLAAGSTYQTTAGAWQSGNYNGTATTVNSLSSVSNFFRVTGVKMELGSRATPLQFRSFQEELSLCQRYYEKTFPYATAPIQNVGSVTGAGLITGVTTGTGFLFETWEFAVLKRTNPTITSYNPTQANANWRDAANAGDVAVVVSIIGERGIRIGATAGLGDNTAYVIHATADAEL